MSDENTVYVVVSNPPEVSASHILWDNAYTDGEKAESVAETTAFASVKKLDVVNNE